MTAEEEATLAWIETNITAVRRRVIGGDRTPSLIGQWKRWLYLRAVMIRDANGQA